MGGQWSDPSQHPERLREKLQLTGHPSGGGVPRYAEAKRLHGDLSAVRLSRSNSSRFPPPPHG